MFWSGGEENVISGEIVSTRAALGPSIVGIAFGAIHCVAWSYVFPSHAELVLWRTSCIAMMAVPLLSTISCTAYTGYLNSAQAVIMYISWALLGLTSWLYIAARLGAIVVAFTTLRFLPSEAFAAVDWTTFIPHI
jgi:hypothetical protein